MFSAGSKQFIGGLMRNVFLRQIYSIGILALSAATYLPPYLEATYWSQTVEISPANSNAITPQIVVDINGNMTAIWSQFDGAHYVVQTASASSKGEWSSAIDLSSPGGNAYFPQVAIDQKGNLIAVWARDNGHHFVIQATTKLSSLNCCWCAPVDLSGSWPEDATAPQVAFNHQGNAFVIWQQYFGGTNIIQCSSKIGMRPEWSFPVNLVAPELYGIGAVQPSLVISQTGGVIAVWRNGSMGSIESAIQNNGKQWSTPFRLSQVGGQLSAPKVDVDKQGNAVAIWSRNAGGTHVIESAAYSPKGGWGKVEAVSLSSVNSFSPQVAFDGNGDISAVWHALQGENTIIQTAFKQFKSSWSSPINLSALGQDASEPQIAAGKNSFTVLWKRSNGAHFAIQAAQKLKNSSWSAPRTLSTGGYDAYFPRGAVDVAGRSAAVWLSSNGRYATVQCSREAF